MIDNYIVFDIETTGLSPEYDKITEIAAIKVKNGKVIDEFNQLINPEVIISEKIISITGITNDLVKDKPTIDEVIGSFVDFTEDYPIMGHNVMFDFSFIKTNAGKKGIVFEKKGIDTLQIAKKYLVGIKSRSLTNLCYYYEIVRENEHRAYDDALATYKLYKFLVDQYLNDFSKKDFLPKALAYKIKKDSPITPKQEKYLGALVRKYKVEFKKEVSNLSKSDASKMIDKIIRENGQLY